MRDYLVQFVVQGESLEDAVRQAERHLNVMGRFVDCDVLELTGGERSKAMPVPATRIEREEPMADGSLGEGCPV